MGVPLKRINTCAGCGVSFHPCQKQQRYCSRECWRKHFGAERRKGLTKDCEICGNTFYVPSYRAKARFCSKACGGKWHAETRQLRGPDLTGNTLRKGIRPTNAFTPEQVRGKANPRWVEPVDLECANCGQSFYRKPLESRPTKSGLRFCSRTCFTTSGIFEGERSPTWVGGPKTYRGRGWRKARLLAVERDGGNCQDCGKHIGDSIPVHHIKPFREFQTVEDANRLENLICLCGSCHMKREYERPSALQSRNILRTSQSRYN